MLVCKILFVIAVCCVARVCAGAKISLSSGAERSLAKLLVSRAARCDSKACFGGFLVDFRCLYAMCFCSDDEMSIQSGSLSAAAVFASFFAFFLRFFFLRFFYSPRHAAQQSRQGQVGRLFLIPKALVEAILQFK